VKLTSEQQSVVSSTAQTLAVNAFAGTGKTSTLVAFAGARPNRRMLYLAFNRSVAEEARARFPANVEAKTSHSLAFYQYGSRYKSKLGNPCAFHVRNVLRPPYSSDLGLVFSSLALEAVERFLMSSSEELLKSHVSAGRAQALKIDPHDVWVAANKVWAVMQDANDPSIPMPHDGYLKLYQLSRPNLKKYAYILLDEAQDTNPCLFKLFYDQDVGRVLVGDEHQNIYSFRGAMNAMQRMRDAERLALTASFRFGEPVANVANAILSTFKGEKLRVRGLAEEGAILNEPVSTLKTCYLHRTNAGLFDQAVNLINQNAKLYFVGGIQGYRFETIMDAWSLMNREKHLIRDPFLRAFNTYDELSAYAESVEDRELKARLKVVDTYTFRIPRLMQRIEECSVAYPEQADVFLATAHKSKGLEWDQVCLGSDFPDLMTKDGTRPLSSEYLNLAYDEEEPLAADEANLLYVAATRAKRYLVPNKQLKVFLSWFGRAQEKQAA